MASTRDIRRRIRSVGSTSQITRAMQMVAASKMRKAQDAALAGRPFVRLIYRFQREATTQMRDFKHPLLEIREVRKRAVILVAADKGLCGALNSNLFRMAAQDQMDLVRGGIDLLEQSLQINRPAGAGGGNDKFHRRRV